MRLQLVRDRFIAGQTECSLRRHLDSVGPDTPIRDIVDICRVWESHAEDTDSCKVRHSPERPQAVYQVVDGSTDSKPEVAFGCARIVNVTFINARISNKHESQTPVVLDDVPYPAAWDEVVSCVGAVRSMKTVTPRSVAVRKYV